MTLADFDAAGAAVLAWLLTYAIHSTILLAAAALAAWRFADHHAWLDVIWKTALVGPIVIPRSTATRGAWRKAVSCEGIRAVCSKYQFDR